MGSLHRHRQHQRKDSAMTRSKFTPDFALRKISTELTHEELQGAMSQDPEAMCALLQLHEQEDRTLDDSSSSEAAQMLEEYRERQWETQLKQDRDRTIFFYVRQDALEKALAVATDPEDRETLAQELQDCVDAREYFLAGPRVRDYTRENLISSAIAGRDHIVRTEDYQSFIEAKTAWGVTKSMVDKWLLPLYKAIADVESADARSKSSREVVVDGEAEGTAEAEGP